MHAAGIYTSPAAGQCCSDYVVSSYTPTLTTLLHARRAFTPLPKADVKVLLAAVPRPFRGAPLAGTVAELRQVRPSLPAASITPLPSPDDALSPTRGAGLSVPTALSLLPTTTILHLASHGTQHPADALQSGFILRARAARRDADARG